MTHPTSSDYLPSPLEGPPIEATTLSGEPVSLSRDFNDNNTLCALAFKVIHDPFKGLITYFRVYAGMLRAGQPLFNVTRNVMEKPREKILYSNT